MSLRIACDLDGTIADMDSALQREAVRLFGPDVSLRAVPGERLESAEDVEFQIGDAPPASNRPVQAAGRPLTRLEFRRLWQHVSAVENFWISLGEIEPGAVARLASLTARHR